MFSSNTTQTSGGYEIQRSLRFNSADSAYLFRQPASAGNMQIFTLSCWIKRSALSVYSSLLNVGASDVMWFTPSDTLQISSAGGALITTAVYRDVSAWYHLVIAFDTTQATASNRIKLYVNGVQITAFGTATYPSQNANSGFNSASQHFLGAYPGTIYHLNGYMTEVNFIDGQALTPSSFGEINADTGVWQPKRYAGSYGTNGFYLNFSDNSNTTAATLGADYSGNGNNWTPNNFSVSAGSGNDSLVDVPTNWGVDTGVGGTVRGNYCTLNPLDKNTNTTLSNGNLDITASAVDSSVRGTVGFPSSGKWYFECIGTAVTGYAVGIADATTPLGNPTSGFNVLYANNAQKTVNGVNTSYGSSFTTDIIGVAYNADANEITFYKNNVSQGALSVTSGVQYFPFVKIYSANVGLNFGQRPFAYTAPSGFKALTTQNLPTPTIGATPATQAGKFFNPVLYTGNSTADRNVTGVGFQPDFVWLKARNTANQWHNVVDSVRGATGSVMNTLYANETQTEVSTNSVTATNYGFIKSLNTDGFTVTSGTLGFDQTNLTGTTYVAWNWKANGAGVTNTAGTITSTVSANTTAGFSVVTYTGNNSTGATIGHGLGVAPSMIILKTRNAASSWDVYHKSLGATQQVAFNSTSAASSNVGFWNNTSPTSSVFTTGSFFANTNTFVAYCFAEISGFSKAFSYTGNGSADGPFSFTGMRPAYLMIKRTDTTSNWTVLDVKRLGYNVDNNPLFPNLSDAEGTTDLADLLSNGFKLRTTDASVNASGGTYIGFAFAESPFKYSLAR